MGLTVDIFRADYDSDLNAFHGRRRLVVVNVSGPSEPSDDAPAARLERGPGGDLILVPVLEVAAAAPSGATEEELETLGWGPALIGPMFGGTFATTSDSRFRAAAGTRAALPIHDRYETPEQNEVMSR